MPHTALDRSPSAGPIDERVGFKHTPFLEPSIPMTGHAMTPRAANPRNPNPKDPAVPAFELVSAKLDVAMPAGVIARRDPDE